VLLLQDGGKCLTREEQKLSVPLAFSHKYAWGNKALWGDIENDFSLLFLGQPDQTQILDAADCYHLPFMGQLFEKTAVGVTCCSKQLVQITASDNLRMSAFLPTKDGVQARFWESAGENASVTVKGIGQSMQYLDFLGNPIAKQEITPHKIITCGWNL
jgi:hypothetical protein